jgi:signal transduction histidine kinase
LDANLADKHPDVAECLMDSNIESYVGVRLESTQGEIMGIIGIIHDKQLTLEDGSIVRTVLNQVGSRVANELDRLRIESNLIYARDAAESTAKNKTKFLADMSHEIRQVCPNLGQKKEREKTRGGGSGPVAQLLYFG